MPWQRLAKALRRWQRELQAHRELALLDGNALRDLGLHQLTFFASTFSCERPATMRTRNLVAAARVGPGEPLLPKVAAQHGLQREGGLSWPGSYHLYSCLRPLDQRYGLILFIKTASALQSWSGGQCPARMAARMLAIHGCEGPTLNAIKIVGILLIVAGLLGLAVGGFSFTRETHQARLGPLECLIKEKQTPNFPAPASVAAVAVGNALLRWRRQEGLTSPHAPQFVSSLPPRGPPATAVALA